MIIAITFAILSVAVVIFTVYYLNKQNKLKKYIPNIKGKHNLKNLWEIEDIRDSIIISGNKSTIIMRIGSIDYHLLSEKEQNVLETNLIEIAKTIKNPLQFFSTTEFIDTTEIINDIKKSIRDKENTKIVEYGENIISYLGRMMENRNLYVRKNYVVISAYGNYEKSKAELLSLYESLRFNLLNAKISLEMLNDYEIIELLHREFNKNTTTKVENILQKGGLELYVRGKRSNREDKSKEKEKEIAKEFI